MTSDTRHLTSATARAVHFIEGWLWTDSRIELTLVQRVSLAEAIENDVVKNSTFPPSDSAAELLVCGGDEGETPLELVERYPETSRFIASFFE